ncbi:MAG TPA: TM2 domain-containing protein [Candidatus Obscuribacterales bacterium]
MTNPGDANKNDKKIVAGILGILLGALGIHKFVLGYTTEGFIMLAITLLTCGFGATVTGIIGLIEGIMYLTKSDDEFVATYINSKRGWF